MEWGQFTGGRCAARTGVAPVQSTNKGEKLTYNVAMTHETYLASLEPERRADMHALDALIRKVAPDLESVLLTSSIGYGPFRYRYATGREGDSARIAISSRKNYIAIYSWALPTFKARFPKAKCGVACLTFKRLGDLDEKAL